MDELEQMREQMASMKQSLDRNRIINGNLIKKVMRQRSSWLGNTVWIEAVSTPIIALAILAVSMINGTSVWFAISFLIFSWIDTAFDYKTLRIPGKWFSELDVITLRKRLLHQKTLRKRQYAISLPLAVVWGVWFCIAMLRNSVGDDVSLGFTFLVAFFIIVGIGVIVGVWLSLVIYRRAQRTNDDLVRQIDEYGQES